MRGFIIAFAIVMGTLLSVQCSKKQGGASPAPPGSEAQERPALAEQKGSDCDCGVTQASCTADCWFTECCICFSPLTHEAGCGCFLGFSSCKMEKLETTPEVNGFEKEHQIRLKEKNIREYFVFLSSISVDPVEIKKSFDALVREALGTETKNGTRKIIVPSSKYDSFMESYRAFAGNLAEEKRTEIEKYLKTKKPR